MSRVIFSVALLLAFSLARCTAKAPPPAPSISGASQPVNPAQPEPLRTLNGELTIVRNANQLPTFCKVAFADLTKESKFEMAQPGKSFQVGDVVIFHLPWRRLVFGGINAERCLIHYEKGGRGHSYYAVLFGTSRDAKAEFLWGGSGHGLSPSLEKLRSDIADGKFRTIGEFETSW